MKQSRGFFGIIFHFAWLIILASLIFSFIQINSIKNVTQFFDYVMRKSNEINACIDKSFEEKAIKCNLSFKVDLDSSRIVNKPKIEKQEETKSDSIIGLLKNELESKLKNIDENFNSTNNFDKIKDVNTKEFYSELNTIKIVDKLDDTVKYNRGDWKHWVPLNKKNKCWNTREQVLFDSAEPDSIILLDKNKKETKDLSYACSIKSGKWVDPYSGVVMTKPSEVDIDHHIPLGRVAISGGKNFDKKKKEMYANDFDVLVMTSAKQNRSKGAKGPSEWMPPKKESHCAYAKRYILIAKKYDLEITKDDKKALEKALLTCEVKE